MTFLTLGNNGGAMCMQILLTGSQGFIGSYLCAELLQNGYHVIGIDNYSKYGKVIRSHDNHPNFSLFEGDVTKVLQNYSFQGIDYIISLAAMIGGISYFHKYAYDLLAANERITAATFDKAIELYKNHKLKRIINLSSSMVFESTIVFPTPEDEVNHCPPPKSTYGFQKLATEYFCKGAYEQYGLPYTIIRPFNCVGVGEEEVLSDDSTVYVGNMKMLMSHVLPDLVYKALHLCPNDPMPILGKGNQIRHYTNGKDLARGVRMAMESERAVNQDFNLSHPRSVSVAELASIVWSKIHGTPLKFEYHPAFEYDVQYRSPDIRKAIELLGFRTEIDVEQSVDEVIKWMRGNLDGKAK
jgi:nucleoside-diphosphate-sugar epimerase